MKWIDWLEKTWKSSIDLCRKLEKKNRQLTNCHFRKLTIIIVDSRLFSQTHDASNENKMQSSFSKKEFSFRWHENVLCKFFIQFTKIRFVVSWFFSRKFSFRWFENVLCKFHSIHENVMFRDFFLKEFFDDFILLIRVFRRAIH